MKLDNVPLLDKLEQLGIEDLFFVCSHPHSDHMGGIRALFKQPRVFFRDEQRADPRFESITIVDDGVTNGLYVMLRSALEDGLGIEDEEGVKTLLRFETLPEIPDTTSGARE